MRFAFDCVVGLAVTSSPAVGLTYVVYQYAPPEQVVVGLGAALVGCICYLCKRLRHG